MDQNLDVVLRDFDANILPSGIMDWELFHSRPKMVIFLNGNGAVFRSGETVPRLFVSRCRSPRIRDILLCPVGWNTLSARVRHPTISTPSRTEHYRTRVRARLISGLPVIRGDCSRFKAAHIFPPSSVTDPAPLAEAGGSTKIGSIQNVLLLRSELHDAWDVPILCLFSLRVATARPCHLLRFWPRGKVLKLGCIGNRDLCPLANDLLRDHFLQGVLKNMKGTSEPTCDHEDPFGVA
ncbi:uncharacterized protein EI90DRAFT_92818 [Cantharellus anzutake]|uniref:uncharacterized protein n=1 Tax=Cantharellus anzutake TaxID=1750568 RepID=UPI0019061B63|nr:uncharacterized protein EI90DRAFT_92818 [Cantharellus anzutake]KAF8336972.1 hypothetical protein EI90DRAFT_92818 [Cantharellus anzutake]